MDETNRFRLFIGIVVSIVVIGVIFVIGAASTGGADNWWVITSAVIVSAIGLVAVLIAWKRLKEIRSGIPSEDERLTAIKERAGYLAFFISMYFCLGLGFIFGVLLEDEVIEVLTVGEIMFMLVAAMGIIYMVTWTAVSRGMDRS